MKPPKTLDTVLGPDETQILKAVNYGLKDIDSIHALTGIPRNILECMLNVLESSGLVMKTSVGYEINASAGSLIAALQAAPA